MDRLLGEINRKSAHYKHVAVMRLQCKTVSPGLVFFAVHDAIGIYGPRHKISSADL